MLIPKLLKCISFSQGKMREFNSFHQIKQYFNKLILSISKQSYYLFRLAHYYQQINIPNSKQQAMKQQSPKKKKSTKQNLISISSDQLFQQPSAIKVNKSKEDDNYVAQFHLVQPPLNWQQKKIEQARQMIVAQFNAQQQLMKQQKQYYDKIVAANKAKRLQAQRIEKIVKEMFGPIEYLSIPVLNSIRLQLQNFDKVCKFEEVQEYKEQVKSRQQLRKELTKYLLLTIEEIKSKIKSIVLSEVEQNLIKPQSDSLRYSYTVASNFETYFFTKLYIKAKVKSWLKYEKQIRIVLVQFRDKNNLPLKRDILNSKANLKQLITATDQSLKCAQTKIDEYEKIQQLIRQHTIQRIDYNNMEEKDNQPQPQIQLNKKINSVNSFASIPQPIRQQPKQTPQQRKARERMELVQQLKAQIKRQQSNMMKHQRTMQRRIQMLKLYHEKNGFFSDVWREMEMM